ncbi:hypothetical protein AAC387_Pa07g0402 [Persea americana]
MHSFGPNLTQKLFIWTYPQNSKLERNTGSIQLGAMQQREEGTPLQFQHNNLGSKKEEYVTIQGRKEEEYVTIQAVFNWVDTAEGEYIEMQPQQ